MLHVPQVLDREDLAHITESLKAATWVNGCATAGPQAAKVKNNQQLPADAPEAKPLGQIIAKALTRHPLFASATLPKTMLPPRFNLYQGGEHFGNHVDSAMHIDPYTQNLVRTDVSTTVFLCDPESYEGGELVIEDNYGTHEVKLPAGDAIIYPGTSLHRVEPVTKGFRLASFLWTQSLIKDDWRRHMLFNLDMSIIKLRAQIGDTEEVLSLTAHYHNLLRQWVEL